MDQFSDSLRYSNQNLKQIPFIISGAIQNGDPTTVYLKNTQNTISEITANSRLQPLALILLSKEY